jgi:hypothetical protein
MKHSLPAWNACWQALVSATLTIVSSVSKVGNRCRPGVSRCGHTGRCHEASLHRDHTGSTSAGVGRCDYIETGPAGVVPM